MDQSSLFGQTDRERREGRSHSAAGGQVDVSLQKNDRKIACEISITTANEQELSNVRKCLDAGFTYVALVVPEQRRTASFEKALRKGNNPGIQSEGEPSRCGSVDQSTKEEPGDPVESGAESLKD